MHSYTTSTLENVPLKDISKLTLIVDYLGNSPDAGSPVECLSTRSSAVKAHQFFTEEAWDGFKQIFEATSIILPEQSLASEKAGLAVSKKGFTLKELLQQTSHHNAKFRRGIISLLTSKMKVLDGHVKR
ncbi:hypothetical protein L2E82_19702 [Cichorium intybus]|uniref:Uncharacterized protein n=1 Tax=Cichorium intybus TaxID=13427 RepID=A0ACB9FDU2_CICIN|nr:hypothetical protein L2E82_19702 [Cichorium intybus]